MLWPGLELKWNVKLWPELPMSFFGLNNYLKNCNLRGHSNNTNVIIKLFFIVAQISYFIKGPKVLRLIVIFFEKRLYLETSRLSLLI